MTAVSSCLEAQSNKISPVYLKNSGEFLKIYLQDKYAGVLASPVLCRLLKDFSIHLKSTLQALEPESGRARHDKAQTRSRECPIRIIVYGLENEKGHVGQVLSDAGMFLQHPSSTDCSSHVKYCNPHYLLRPGSEMPELQNLSLETESDALVKPDELNDVSRARLQRIFDCADISNTEAPFGVVRSVRLRSELMQLV